MHLHINWRAIKRMMHAGAGLSLACVLTMGAGAQAQNTTDRVVPLTSYDQAKVNALLKNARFLGQQSPDTAVKLAFTLPLRNQAQLQSLINDLYDPSSPSYHKYLTSAQFAASYGPTQNDLDTVVQYATSIGLKVEDVSPTRNLVVVSGPTSAINTDFGVHLNRYLLPSGRIAYAADTIPTVPKSVQSIIDGIIGFSDIAQHHKHSHTVSPLDRAFDPIGQALGGGPNGFLAPADINKAYGLQTSNAGAGVTMAVVELDGYVSSDIQKYGSEFSFTVPPMTNVLINGFSGEQDGSANDDPEVVLDIDMALAIAPQLKTLYVYESAKDDADVLDMLQKIAGDNLANTVSDSWGEGEDQLLSDTSFLTSENAAFEQMATQGQSFFAAAGDTGAYEDTVNPSVLTIGDPGEPYATVVGGTSLTLASGVYSGETVWNDLATNNGAGGGGISAFWPKPSYQSGVQGQVSGTTTFREVPDVALDGDPASGYDIYIADQGGWKTYGGTSAATPLWAAFTALVDQELGSKSLGPIGFINPAIYKIGQTASEYSVDFHDITTGTNGVYAAKAGFDDASGWGSFIGNALITQLAGTAGVSSSITGTISGTVTDANDNPVSGATVNVYNGSTHALIGTTTSASGGAYSITKLPVQTNLTATATAADLAGQTFVDLNIPLATTTTGGTLTQNFTMLSSYTFPPDLQLVSAPYEYGGIADFSTLFGISDDPPVAGNPDSEYTTSGGGLKFFDPALFYYNPEQLAYVWTSTYPADTFHLGYGYWVKFPTTSLSVQQNPNTYFSLQGNPAPLSNFYINLHQGWNMIGDPFTANVSLGLGPTQTQADTAYVLPVTTSTSTGSTVVEGPLATSTVVAPAPDQYLYTYPGGTAPVYRCIVANVSTPQGNPIVDTQDWALDTQCGEDGLNCATVGNWTGSSFSYAVGALVKYKGYTQVSTASGTLQPYAGYWIYATADCVLELPVPGTVGPPPPPVKPGADK